MSTPNLDKLRADYEAAEAKTLKLQSEKDEALQKVIDKYRDRQREANAATADAQKALADAEAAAALAGREDMDDNEKVELAATLGLTLPGSLSLRASG